MAGGRFGSIKRTRGWTVRSGLHLLETRECRVKRCLYCVLLFLHGSFHCILRVVSVEVRIEADYLGENNFYHPECVCSFSSLTVSRSAQPCWKAQFTYEIDQGISSDGRRTDVHWEGDVEVLCMRFTATRRLMGPEI
jgi:hypothetical protein